MYPDLIRMERSFRRRYGLPQIDPKEDRGLRPIPMQLPLPFSVPLVPKKEPLKKLRMTSGNLRLALNNPELIRNGQFSIKRFRVQLGKFLRAQQDR